MENALKKIHINHSGMSLLNFKVMFEPFYKANPIILQMCFQKLFKKFPTALIKHYKENILLLYTPKHHIIFNESIDTISLTSCINVKFLIS